MAQGKNKKKTGNAAEASSRSLQSGKKTPKALKPEPKIIKKTPNQNSAKTLEGKKSPNQSSAKTLESKKSPNQNSAKTLEGKKSPNPNSAKTLKGKKPRNQNSAKALESKGTPRIQGETKDEKKSTQESNKEESTKNQRSDEKKPNSQEGNKGKSVTNEEQNKKNQKDQKDKGLFGGLIFMCNGKTKPDCFRYGVMGVSANKKELVMGIKPGLKLFLYDFDLRLMYGIYKASSAGGMKLEPNAFGGAFPFQVRFKVHKDCFPLPESVFKKAIKDNYNEKKQKFKTELTVQQAKELIELFRPVQQHHSNAHSFVQVPPPTLILRPPPMPTVPAGETFEDRREPLPQSRVEPLTRDPYLLDEGRRFYMPSDQEREKLSRHPASTNREMASAQKEAVPRDPLFLSEKEYRTYGLGRAQRTSTPPAAAPAHQKDHYGEQLPRHPASIHRESAPAQKQTLSCGPLYLSEREYRSYGLVGREPPTSTPPTTAPTAPTSDHHLKDPYYPYRYGGASSDQYPLPPRREATASEPYSLFPRRETFQPNYDYPERGVTDHSLRRGTDEGERLYSTYASNALSDYNQKQHHLGGSRAELASVSSRYSFAGPSLSYH